MSGYRPRVSVVVPAFNEAQHIEACLDALLNQDYPGDRYQVMVVDNASTDATAALVARYPVTCIREPIRSPARARNAGIAAARGECVAFVDADCVPCREWLSALLMGWEDPEVGCFVGEIEGAGSSRLIAKYVQDRQLISQRELLSAAIPVAATGSIAFRRTVFETVGLFDEAFRFGEDADLTWRLQKWGGFAIRYNPRALVAHAHPESLPELLRRRYHEGLGLAAFRIRHGDDIPRDCLSRSRYRYTMVMAMTGLLIYPRRVFEERRRARPLVKALVYPLIDKLCSLALMSGITHGLPKERPPRVSPTRREASDPSRSCPARDWDDRLIMDLAREQLFRHQNDELTGRARRELAGLCDLILSVLPGASVLLTGSLSVGEGRWRSERGRVTGQSDYDLVVVSKVPFPVGLHRLRQRLAQSPLHRSLSADVDLAYAWQPLIKRGWMTTGGRLIAGDPGIVHWLHELPAPRASSALVRGFLNLAGAPLTPEQFSNLISKALVQAAQAFLLSLCQDQPRREWIGLSSLAVIRKRADEQADRLGSETVADIARAVSWLAGDLTPPWGWEERARTLAGLRRIAAQMPMQRGWRYQPNLMLGLWQAPFTGQAHIANDRSLITTLGALAECWTDGRGPDVHCLERLGPRGGGTDTDPLERYRALYAPLAAAVEHYPHKLRWRHGLEYQD